MACDMLRSHVADRWSMVKPSLCETRSRGLCDMVTFVRLVLACDNLAMMRSNVNRMMVVCMDDL